MVSNFFRPAVLAMHRLSFPLKFALVSALFAVPLTITSVQTIHDRQKKIEVYELKQNGIAQVIAFQQVIESLEQLRDLSIAHRISSYAEMDELFANKRKQSVDVLAAFAKSHESQIARLVELSLEHLRFSLTELRISTGSEGDNVYSIFDSVNLIVNAAYDVQSKIINQHGLLFDSHLLATQLALVLDNEIQPPMESLGRARAYGTYFLSTDVIGSHGIELVEQTVQELFEMEKRLRARFTLLVETYPEMSESQRLDLELLSEMSRTANLIEEAVLLDPDLQSDWQSYYQQSSDSIQKLNVLKAQISSLLSYLYKARAKELSDELWGFVTRIGLLVLIFLYLFVGFFVSVRESLSKLSSGALNVAKGSLDEAVRVDSKDEMADLAKVLDQMREQLKTRQDQLVELASTDGLTKIHNRAYFNRKLEEQINLTRSADRPLTLLLIDIDFFKKLNDTHGHQAGDYCLIELAKLLKRIVNRPEDEAARYGGEEFAVLLPSTTMQGGERVAETICEEIRKLPLEFQSKELRMTVSVGIASSASIENLSTDLLVSVADTALYEAKNNGRDCWESLTEEQYRRINAA